MRQSKFSKEVSRGVYIAPWMGPNDELIMVAITSQRRQACEPVMVAPGDNSIEIADRLWGVLDREDPDLRTVMKVI